MNASNAAFVVRRGVDLPELGPGHIEAMPAQDDDLRQRVADEAARQASAAQAARSHSDPDAPERARAHDFCAAVLESLLEEVVKP